MFNSLGWWTALTFAYIALLLVATAVTGVNGPFELRDAWSRGRILWTIGFAVTLVLWFLTCAYMASNPSDPVPVP